MRGGIDQRDFCFCLRGVGVEKFRRDFLPNKWALSSSDAAGCVLEPESNERSAGGVGVSSPLVSVSTRM